MKTVFVDALLGVIVLSAWVSAFGFLRLASAFDRLHCVTFATIGCGCPLLLAAIATDGASIRVMKLFALVAVELVAGAAVTPCVGRAIYTRSDKADVT